REMARALAAGEPALAVERAGRPHDLEMHRDSGSAHVGRGEAYQLAHGHVVLVVPTIVVPALTVPDSESDGGWMLARLDQPLPVGRDGVLSREYGSCQEAGQEKDGEPHRDSGSGFRELDGKRAPRVAGLA